MCCGTVHFIVLLGISFSFLGVAVCIFWTQQSPQFQFTCLFVKKNVVEILNSRFCLLGKNLSPEISGSCGRPTKWPIVNLVTGVLKTSTEFKLDLLRLAVWLDGCKFWIDWKFELNYKWDKYLIVRTIASLDDLLCKNTGKVFDLVEWM